MHVWVPKTQSEIKRSAFLSDVITVVIDVMLNLTQDEIV